MFLPTFLDRRQFYLTSDYHFLVDKIRHELAYLRTHWQGQGRPTVTLMLTRSLLTAGNSALLKLMQELQDGDCDGVAIKLGRLNELALTASQERIDNLHDFELMRRAPIAEQVLPTYLNVEPEQSRPLSNNEELRWEREQNEMLLLQTLRQSNNLYEQIEILSTLLHLKGANFDTGLGRHDNLDVTVQDLLEELYNRATVKRWWSAVRRTAGLLQKVDLGLADAVTDIVVRQKVVAVGKAYTEDSIIDRPSSQTSIAEKIRKFCSEDVREHVLTQEILLYLSLFVRSNPGLLDNSMTLRVSNLMLLITGELARELSMPQDEAYEEMMRLSPFEMKNRLEQALQSYSTFDRTVVQQESLHVRAEDLHLQDIEVPDAQMPEPEGGWLRMRKMQGGVNSVPPGFYQRVWQLMQQCRGLVIGDKLERRNRLDSDTILAEMTPGEKNFALAVEHLLNKTAAPEYRQLNVEALMVLAEAVESNPSLDIQDYLVMDVLIGHAVRLAWLEEHPEHTHFYRADGHMRSQAWNAFYDRSPYECEKAVLKSLSYLIESGSREVALSSLR